MAKPATRPAPDPTSHESIARRAEAAIQALTAKGSLLSDKKKEIADLIETMLEQMTKQRDIKQQGPSNDENTATESRLNNIEKGLQELKELITTKTYAQAASSAPQNSPAIIAKKQQQEEARKERARLEVTLSASNTTEDIKKQLSAEHPAKITEHLQKAINETTSIADKPRILGINKVANDTIKLQFDTAAEAEQIRSATIDWNVAYNGIKAHRPSYGVAVFGIPTGAINLSGDHAETVKSWENQNGTLTIAKISTLRSRSKHKPTAYQSYVIFTEDKDAANKLIKQGFFIDNEKFKTGRYNPHLYITQCFKCHGFGHRAANCNHKQKCGHCGQESHLTNDCTHRDNPHCVNCKGNHAAWHVECPTRDAEGKRLSNLRIESPSFF